METIKIQYNDYFDNEKKGVILGVTQSSNSFNHFLIILGDDGRVKAENISDMRQCRIIEETKTKKHK